MRPRILSCLSLPLLAAGIALAAPESAPSDRAELHRAFLEWECGEWDATITMAAPDGGQPTVLAGRQTDRLGACGLWLITDLALVPEEAGGEAPPYEGHGVLGYDPAKEKLVGLWVDSKTDWLAVAEGEVSQDGKTLTLVVEGRHPMTRQPIGQQFVTTKIGADRRRLEVFVPLPDGERMLAARIDYERRAAAKPAADH